MQANNRAGVPNELFGMDFDQLMPYAEAWEKQNSGPRGYGEMRKFQDWDNVGDYYVNEDGSGALYYANWDVAGILFRAAPSSKHNVSLEGTSGKTSYRLSFGYDSREGTIAFNPPTMKRYNVTANINTEIFSWWKAGVRFSFGDKVYDGPNYWRNPYTYGWRWGSYFGPYGYMRDKEGVAYDCNSAVGYAKPAVSSRMMLPIPDFRLIPTSNRSRALPCMPTLLMTCRTTMLDRQLCLLLYGTHGTAISANPRFSVI